MMNTHEHVMDLNFEVTPREGTELSAIVTDFRTTTKTSAYNHSAFQGHVNFLYLRLKGINLLLFTIFGHLQMNY
jgi:hypothetical protein